MPFTTALTKLPGCELPSGEATCKELEGGLQTIANKKLRPSSNGPEKWKPANNHIGELGTKSSPVEDASGATKNPGQHLNCSLVRNSVSEDLISHAWILDPNKLRENKYCCFKSL